MADWNVWMDHLMNMESQPPLFLRAGRNGPWMLIQLLIWVTEHYLTLDSTLQTCYMSLLRKAAKRTSSLLKMAITSSKQYIASGKGGCATKKRKNNASDGNNLVGRKEKR